jgi:hypothetical protein
VSVIAKNKTTGQFSVRSGSMSFPLVLGQC